MTIDQAAIRIGTGRLAIVAMAALIPAAPPSIAGARATAAPSYPLGCAYAPADGELSPQGACARVDGGTVRIDPAHLARVTFERGLAEIRIGGVGIVYARRDGRTATVFIIDNGGDYFVEGLARGLRGGRLVYYDRRLRPRIVTGFDWGEPFDHGRAAVCTGCRPVSDGHEHSVMTGGRWGVIDRRGRIVVPLKAN